MQDNWNIQFDGEPHRKKNPGIRYLAGVPMYYISLGFLFFFGNYLGACLAIVSQAIAGSDCA